MSAPTAAPPQGAQKVFISYRRQETAAHAGRLYDAMVTRFGERNVFMDVDMAPGVDFVKQITEVVSGCLVLIVVMGPNWATVEDGEGARRLDDPADFVRLEVETAIQRDDVIAIPALVSGAKMPRPEELPPELRPITRRNALELSETRWGFDVGRLFASLDEVLGEGTRTRASLNPQPLPPEPPEPVEPPGWRLVVEGVLVAGATAAFARVLADLSPVPKEAKVEPSAAETALHIGGMALRRTEVAALTGVVLAVWLSRRLASAGRSHAWLRGLLIGVIAGVVGGAIALLPSFLPEENLKVYERNEYELAAVALTGALFGGLLGSFWRPPRVGAALLAGAAGGLAFQAVVVLTRWNNSQLTGNVISFALAFAAIAGAALAAMVLLDSSGSRRRSAAPGKSG